MILQSDYPKPTTNPSATNQVTPKKTNSQPINQYHVTKEKKYSTNQSIK